MSTGRVTTNIREGIATVTFFHPQSNSLPGILLEQLAAKIQEVGQISEVRAIILRSEGEKTFCAGASFDELASINNIEEGTKFFSGFASVINAIRKVPVFVIALVQGKAVGGGVGLACAADYTLAHESASVKLSELAVGIGPFVVGPAVERKIGKAAFSTLTINASNWQTAAWAFEKNMYAAIYSTHDELEVAVQGLAHKLALSNPEAMTNLKKIFWEGTENWDTLLKKRAEISGQLVLSEFTKKAIAKFAAGAR